MRKAIYLLLTGIILMLGLMLTGCKTMAATNEEQVLYLVNEERVSNGLQPLTIDSDLTLAAKIRAEEASRCYSHTRPDGTSCFTVSDKANSENLAKAYSYNTLSEVVDAWMNSQGHKENILWTASTTTGIGICKMADGSYYVAELFN